MAAPSSSPSGTRWTEWLPVISLLLGLLGAALAGGGYVSQLQDNTRRVTILESKSDAGGDKLNTIDVRTARIEAKLELLTTRDKEVQR